MYPVIQQEAYKLVFLKVSVVNDDFLKISPLSQANFLVKYNENEFLENDTAAAAAKSLQSCPTLCDPLDGSPPGSPIPGILQTRTLEWVAISFSNAWKWKVKLKSLSRVWLLATPMDYSLPGSSIHGISQARVLEWDAIAFSWISAKLSCY